MIRHAEKRDLHELIELYHKHLTKSPPENPPPFDEYERAFERITAREGTHILIAQEDGAVVSAVTLTVIDNLTHGIRPYALIENVVTRADCRGRGLATAVMERACDIAREAGCYKVMLLTGSKQDSTLRFYERCGFNRNDKTGFIRWL